jgi:hypothetical protein
MALMKRGQRMAEEKKGSPEDSGWRRRVKDITLLAAMFVALGGATTVLYYAGVFIAPYSSLIIGLAGLAILLAVVLFASTAARPKHAVAERYLFLLTVALPVAALMVAIQSIGEYADVPKRHYMPMLCFCAIVVGFLCSHAARRYVESEVRLAVLERAFRDGHTDLQEAARDYINDTINARGAFIRRISRSVLPSEYREHVKD